MKFILQKNFEGELAPDMSYLGMEFPLLLETDMYFSEDKTIFISKYRVMFGYRLHAGFIDTMDSYFELDICCGIEPENYTNLFNKIVSIISKNGSEDPFKGIPTCSVIKPYMKDDNFKKIIEELNK